MSRRAFLTASLLALTAVGAAPAVVYAAPNASARATVGTFFSQDTEVSPVDGTECVSGIGTGIETATFTVSGHFVATNSGFHFEGTQTIDSHTVFTSGYHIDASGHAHFEFYSSFTSGQTVSTSAGPEVHTIFNAQDQAVAQVKFVGVSHTTYRDLNGNGQPDDGEITSSFDRFHFICS